MPPPVPVEAPIDRTAVKTPEAPPKVFTVVDKEGTRVLLSGVSIDYTVHSGGMVDIYTPDHEGLGIRGFLGSNPLVIHWDAVQQVRILDRIDTPNGKRLRGEVTSASGAAKEILLLAKGNATLEGKTDLGDFSIALDRIDTIVPGKAQ